MTARPNSYHRRLDIRLFAVALLQGPMLRPHIPRPVVIVIAKIPRLTRPDQPATPRTNHATSLNLPTHAIRNIWWTWP